MSPAVPSVGPLRSGVELSRSAHVIVSPAGSALYQRPLTHGGGGKRGRVTGWTRSSARRHVRWLQSVDGDQLDGDAFAVTLTVRDIPAGPQEWHEALHQMQIALARFGVLRGHWVMENQKRGCPHLHLGVWFGPAVDLDTARGLIIGAWLRIAAEWRPAARGQDVKALEHGGWSKYVAKHSARSVTHVQRTGLPPGWETSGRLWGHFGDWDDYRSELEFMVDSRTWVQLRRLLRDWRRADAARALATARAAAEVATNIRGREVAIHHLRLAKSRVRATRRNALNRGYAMVQGMREWVPRSTMLAMIEWAVNETPGGWVLFGEDLLRKEAG